MVVKTRLQRLASQVCAGDPFPEIGSEAYRMLVAGDTAGGKPRPREDPTARRNEGMRWALPPVAVADIRARTDAILSRYDEERDKRLEGSKKLGGTYQYPRVADLAKTDERFAKMIADPHIEQDGSQGRVAVGRPPKTDEVAVTLIGGGGYGGLTAGARLAEAGIPSSGIRLMDRGGDVGGTWYWNRYPGAMCDTEAPIYMPLLEETNYAPSERYAHQHEIMTHAKRICTHFGLYENALFATECTELCWDEAAKAWIVSTDRGDRFHSKYVLANFGVFTHPKLPATPGVQDFGGHMFHTSRWDYDYTGGNNLGGLTKLQDKVVGIIGSGPTAIQAIPHLGEWCRHLYSFQRTPSAVDVRNNHFLGKDSAFYKKFMSKPGWQKERIEIFTKLLDGSVAEAAGTEDIIGDGWTSSVTALQDRLKADDSQTNIDAKKLFTEIEHMERIRARIPTIVKDPATAKILTPWFSLWCKRPCFHDEYLPCFNRPNVTLVDVSTGGGAQLFTKKGLVANGKEYEMDCLIFATGFEHSFAITGLGGDTQSLERTSKMTVANGYEIIGKGGLKLSEKWANGCRTLNSYNVRGFPNLWIINGPQGIVTSSIVTQIDEGGKHMAHMVARLTREGKREIEPKQVAEDAYSNGIYESSMMENMTNNAGQAFYKNCTPGYYNGEGNVKVGKTLNAAYGGGIRGSATEFIALRHKEQETNTVFDDYDVA